MNALALELDLARNTFGPLSPAIRRKLQAYYDAPTIGNWEEVYRLIVGADRWMTVWQAWIATDPTAPKVGRVTDEDGRVERDWERWPTREAFVKALQYATH